MDANRRGDRSHGRRRAGDRGVRHVVHRNWLREAFQYGKTVVFYG